MDSRLATLVCDYLAAVSSAVELMKESGIDRPESNTAWACNDIPQKGTLHGEVKYFKHGYGCAVHLSSGVVDFDFGEKGEIDGFDAWRLAGFAADRLRQYGFNDEGELSRCFKRAVEEGSLVYSGYILHYLREARA